MKRNTVFVAAIVMTAFILGLSANLLRHRLAGDPATATLFSVPRELPTFALPALALNDENGTLISADRFKGQWDLLFFGFTHCPDVCPTTLYGLHGVAGQLEDLPLADQPRVWLVSVDPQRDSPDVLKTYLSHFDSRFAGITGETDQIAALAAALGVAYQRIELGDDYTMEHSTALFLIDRQGRYAGLFSSPYNWDDVAHDLRVLSR